MSIMEEGKNNKGLEAKIIATAQRLFIEKGFAETSMSDIALETGINRPALHYYFRTKERMFHAVFGPIVLSFLPRLSGIIQQKDKSLPDRIKEIVDVYSHIFVENPNLPLFIVREMQRDPEHLLRVLRSLQVESYLQPLLGALREAMGEERWNSFSLPFLFYTFYGLLAVPFLTKGMGMQMFFKTEDEFKGMLSRWKPYVVRQLVALLSGNYQ